MYSEYHEKLKAARLEAGYTQKQIEKILKIPQPVLSRIEKGEHEPSIQNLCKLTCCAS